MAGTDWNKVGAIGTWSFGIIGLFIYVVDKFRGGDQLMSILGWLPAILIALAILGGAALQVKASRAQGSDRRNELKELASERDAKMDREGRLQQLQKLYDSLKAEDDRKITDLQRTNQELKEEITGSQNECAGLRAALDKKAEQSPIDNDAPQLWVDYKGRDEKAGQEILVFSKDGDRAIRIKEVGPFVWHASESYPVSLFNVIGFIRNDPVECRFTAFREELGSQVLFKLPDLIRRMMNKFGAESQPRIDIKYEDMNGNLYSRRFVLSIDPYDRVVWEPEMTRRVTSGSEVI